MADTQRPDRSGQFWLIPGEQPAQLQRVATIAVPRGRGSLLIASIANELLDAVRIGSVVQVESPRKKPILGLCLEISEKPWNQTRPRVSRILIPETLLTPELVQLGRRVSEYYVAPPGSVFAAVLPTKLRTPRMIRIRWLRSIPGPPDEKLSPRQTALLAALRNGPRRAKDALNESGASPAILATLRKNGRVEQFDTTEPAPPQPNRAAALGQDTIYQPEAAEDRFTLTADQQTALQEIQTALDSPHPNFIAYLLFGIPGSGKTEVYIRAIRHVIAAQCQAILLVPEIALATQVVARLARRFERVAILHSRLTPRARADTLRAIAAGRADVVIGTRTAVFAPCPRLGLILVDEEQETSFKNQASPRFHARDVALLRAQLAGIPAVLGSATPSLETWHNATTLPHFRRLILHERVPGAKLPHVTVTPCGRRDEKKTAFYLDERLVQLLRETLARNQQAVILHNRRGYARSLQCDRCGLTPMCDRCRAPLVFHENAAQLKCHRCGYVTQTPSECANSGCGGELLRIGIGIQRIREELLRILPGARILRVDSDTLKHRSDYIDALHRMESREIDILLGTQIVAKGLDFPGVNLVGVIDADATLWLPDFRAAERTFQLLMQVIGRAGRRDGDSVAFLQTRDAAVPAIRYAAALDYPAFAEHELLSRKRWNYPPFSRMARIILADDRPQRAATAAQTLSAGLRSLAERVNPAIVISDGEPCPVLRHRDRLRYQVVIRAPRDGSLQRLLHQARSEHRLHMNVQRQIVDIDPVDML